MINLTPDLARRAQYGRNSFYLAALPGYRLEVHENPQAHTRAAGTWFLELRRDGEILTCFRAQAHTLRDALAAVEEFLAVAPVELDRPEPAPAAPVVVIACAAEKQQQAAPARELYTSRNFRLNLRAAEKLAAEQGGRVLILSALHGLIEPDAVIEPYNLHMKQAGAIGTAELAQQLNSTGTGQATCLLPKHYLAALTRAAHELSGVEVTSLYPAGKGIGYQRAVASQILAN